MRHVEAAVVALVVALFAFMVWAGATSTDCVSGRNGEWECVNQWTREPVEEPGWMSTISYPLGNVLKDDQ